MRNTTRSAESDGSFVETTTGDAPNSVEVSFNARGVAQVTVKLYYASPDELVNNAGSDVWSALYEVSHELIERGIPVAGLNRAGGEEPE